MTDEERRLGRVVSLRKYESAHPDRVRASKKAYEQRNPGIVAARKRAWFEANPDYLRARYEWQRIGCILKTCKVRAKKKGIPFDLDPDDIVIPSVCPVLGIPISLDVRGSSFAPNSPSVDRLIPALGYVRGNVRVISNRANILKRDGTLAELEAVVAYMKREGAL